MNEKLRQYFYAVILICLVIGAYYVYTTMTKESEMEITVQETPKEILVGEAGTLTFTVRNTTEEQRTCDISIESQYVDTNATFTETLDAGGAGSFTTEIRAKNVEKTAQEVILTIVVQSEERTTKDVAITVKKPEVVIQEITPSEMKVGAKSTKYISVAVKNKEKIGIENLTIQFTSGYKYYTVDREGIEEIDGLYVYHIDESLLYNEEIRKTFYLTSDLAPGSTRVEYVLTVELLWKEFVMDEREIHLEVVPAGDES